MSALELPAGGRRAVTVVGLGDDGCLGLSARAANAVAAAQVLAGGERHLAFFPQFRGERIVLKSELREALAAIAARAAEHQVVVLASGDPLFFGIGARVIAAVGAAHVEVLPAPSSVQWAFARAGLSWDDAAFVSLHGRAPNGLLSRLRRLRKVALLTDEERAPRWVARQLLAHGDDGFDAWLCEELGGPRERVRRLSLVELAEVEAAPLNVVLLVRRDPAWRPPPVIPYLPEEAFARKMPRRGLITKREVRLLALGLLQLRPRSVVWDVGAGSGSVAIEAGLIAHEGSVFAVEVDPVGVELCRENVRLHGADNVRVVAGRAPEALADLPAPDAVFVGGSQGALAEIVDASLARLSPGGRLVVNAITLENVSEAYRCLRERGLDPEVSLVQVSRGEKLAGYLRLEAQNPIYVFGVSKPVSNPDGTAVST